MVSFYQNILGFEIYARLGTATFLKIDDDYEGHPQLLAIFDQDHTFSGPKNMNKNTADTRSGSLHHFAFVMDKDVFNMERERIQRLDIDLQYAEHTPFGWRSLYLFDPDGNSVELVCYEANLLDNESNRKIRG